MSKAVTGTENIYFEMESKEPTAYQGVNEGVVGESKTTSVTKQMTSEKQQGSSSLSEATIQRLLHVMAALVVVSFLIATATLILVLLPVISRNTSTTSADCVTGLHGIEKKVQDLTERLETTQRELKTLKTQLDGQLAANSTRHVQENDLKYVWMAINSTAEKTSNLSNKVMDGFEWLEGRVEIEEQKSNHTSQLTGKLVADHTIRLEQLSRHIASLWNTSNSTAIRVNELNKGWTEINKTLKESSSLINKVNNISQMAGPVGPPGFNGTQGPAGPAGSRGPPGPKGLGNFSACRYDEVSKPKTPGSTYEQATLDEPSGFKVIAATCSTDLPKGYNLASAILSSSSTRRYVCNCIGDANNPSDGTICKLNYWLCPTT